MKRLGSDSSVYSEDEVRKHVFTILKAVHYMHSKHCVHRDIKPENVLLSDNSDEAEVRELTWPLRPSTHTHTHRLVSSKCLTVALHACALGDFRSRSSISGCLASLRSGS